MACKCFLKREIAKLSSIKPTKIEALAAERAIHNRKIIKDGLAFFGLIALSVTTLFYLPEIYFFFNS